MRTENPKILILGVSGIIGHKAWEIFRRRFGNEVYGTVRRPKAHYSAIQEISKSSQNRLFYEMDFHDADRVLPFLEE
ncbi:MAG: hypothetical protein V4760_03810, partial [Bdellovibrionota bacterium]